MRRFLTILPIFAIFALGLTAPAQQPSSRNFRVAGTVVSAIDNHPLQRASIQLLNPDDQRPLQTTASDEYGRFAFTAVPAGNHVLQGTAPSYLATTYDEHEGFNTGIVTGAGVDTESLTLKLIPASGIAGTVVDEAAEPVQNATVHLFRQTHIFGDSRLVPAVNINTDDLGRFDIPHLLPGTYFLAITATPWYAIHPNPVGTVAVDQFRGGPLRQRGASTPPFANSALSDSIDPILDAAYPATFYPGTTDPTRASPILLRGGDSLDLHFQLSPQPAVTLTVPRPTPVMGEPQPFPQLSIPFRGQMLPAMGEIRMMPTQTSIAGLAPGDYFLSDTRTFNPANAGTPIHLSEHSTDATLAPASDLAHVHVLLQPAHGAPLPPHLRVILRQRQGDASAGQADEKNEASLDAAAGDYSFEVYDRQRPLAVLQIVANSASGSESQSNLPPHASNAIRLAAGDKLSFTLTLTPAIHTLKGVVRKDGKPFPGAFILLFPSDQASDIRTPFRQQSDLDGSFDIRGLAPGAYTLVAIENGWDLNWQHPDTLTRYLPAALTIHIQDTAEKVQSLPNPIPVQPR